MNERSKEDKRAHEDESVYLIERLRAGESMAEIEFVNRYLHRLVGLAKKELSPKLQARFDPEDAAQSALGSFCVRLQDGRLIPQENNVWSLLAKITLNKVRGLAAHHTAQRRDVKAEEHYASSDGLMRIRYSSIPDEPSVTDVAICEEQIQGLLGQFDSAGKKMIELRLENCSVQEIAEQVSRSEHQVKYVMRKARLLLERWAMESLEDS